MLKVKCSSPLSVPEIFYLKELFSLVFRELFSLLNTYSKLFMLAFGEMVVGNAN